MPIYEFRCESDHEYERSVPMSTRDQDLTCPRCGASSRRRISAPRLGTLGSAAGRLLESTAASAHEPAVVDRIPGARRTPGTRTTLDPRHARLPRP
ncbi:zinc ribbon domain-containing protein [Brachybacterium paraconglomeratum]|uniref:FmdB family zinc ribbon protein n=1 Tax=Brachybacterium paraconglomeratum TaxID=173362 RepID=UPI0031EEE567